MKIENANRIRRAAGLPDLTKEERVRIEEKVNKESKKQSLMEAANNRPSSRVLADIAKQHLHVRSLEKTGDDNKDYHDCPIWAIESALKAAFKAGQQSAPKSVKESVDMSSKEAKYSGCNYDPKGGEPIYKSGEDSSEEETESGIGLQKGKSAENYQTPKNKTAKEVTEAKKLADKDYDKDGKLETPYQEYYGSRGNAMRKAKKKTAKEVTEAKKLADKDYDKDGKLETEREEHYGSVGNAIRKAKKMKAKKMSEGSSEGYNNPNGSTLKSDPKSGAEKDHPNVYKKVVHKDNSKSAKSEDKGKSGLKKISEQDATVWDKDYNMDGRIDKDESPDQLAIADPTATDKVLVPTRLKTVMREEIRQLREEADKVHVRDPIGSEFYKNAADAFENLLGHLEEGTKRSIALAQIDVNRVMSPMVTRIPNEVYMFIVRGGKPSALTELFKEVKIKRETGADLSKETYTT